MVQFSLNGKPYSVTRPKLQKWLQLEETRDQAIESAEGKRNTFVTNLFAYLSALLDIPEESLINAPWYEVLEGFYLASVECAPKLDLSIISSSKRQKAKPTPDPWEYDGRIWYAWVHMLAGKYHWDIERIAGLDVDDALALIQEISLEEQFEKEWEWSLSEVAYEYDKSSKKSKLRKLPRPDWMGRATKYFQKSIERPKPPILTRASINKISLTPPGVVLYDTNTTADNEGGSSPP